MAVRKKYGKKKPLRGLKLMGSLHMTIQTACLIETLKELGADLRGRHVTSFQPRIMRAAAIANRFGCCFCLERRNTGNYWWCTEQALTWPTVSGPDLIVDDGGDATLFIHQGVKNRTQS